MLSPQTMNQINHTAAALVVHGLADALLAVAAARCLDRPLTMISAPGAAAYAGPVWFLALVERARAAAPDASIAGILDCADDPGHALAALRAGAKAIVFTGDDILAKKLAALAEASGAVVLRRRPPCCDPEFAEDRQAAYAAFLSGA